MEASAEPAISGGEVMQPMLAPLDDVVDVKLDLFPAGTRPFSVYDKLMGSPFHVRENYDFIAPQEGGLVSISVSHACADSILLNDGYVNVPQGTGTFSEFRNEGKISGVSHGAHRGVVTFRDMPPGKAMILCNNQAAAAKVSPGAATTESGLGADYDYAFRPHHTDIMRNDILSDANGYRTRAFFADGEEGYFDGGTWGRLVEGKYGLLAIHNHHLVQYVPKADPSVIGKVDVFPYKLVHPTLGASDANIIVRIDSDQADVEWDESDPYSPAQKADVWDYANTAMIEVLGEITTETKDGACSYNWQGGDRTNEPGVTGKAFKFTVDDASLTRLTIDIFGETLPSLLEDVRVVCFRTSSPFTDRAFPTDSADRLEIVEVDDGHLQAVSGDLDAGTYLVYVANREQVPTPGHVDVDLTFETTRFAAVATTPAIGNVLGDEGHAAESPRIAITQDGDTYQVLGEGGTRLYGNYGELVLQANGDYVYEPSAELQGVAKFDTFRYRLHREDGTVEDARLTIAIRMGDDDPDNEELAPAADAVPLAGLEAEGDEKTKGNDTAEHLARKRALADSLGGGLQDGEEALLLSEWEDESVFPTNPIPPVKAPTQASMGVASALADVSDQLTPILDEGLVGAMATA